MSAGVFPGTATAEGPSGAARSEDSGRGAPIAQCLLWCATPAAVAVALGPLLADYAMQTWRSEHYQFIPLLLAAVAFLAIVRLRLSSYSRPRGLIRVISWSAALLATAGAVFVASPFGAALALMMILFAAIYECGRPAFRRLLPVWALLWLAVRPPFNLDQSLVIRLQKLATTWASAALDVGGIRHLADGVAIRLPEQSFFVDEACSGIHSLFAALAFAGVFSVALNRGFVRTLLMLVATVFWVIVANTLRIGALVVLLTRYDLPVTDGLGHELLGVATFAVAVALILSTDRLLLFFVPLKTAAPFNQQPDAASYLAAERSENRFPVRRTRPGLVAPLLVGVAFAAIAGAAWYWPATAFAGGTSPLATTDGFKVVTVDALPARWQGWNRIHFETVSREAGAEEGELSRIWRFSKGRLVAAISVDGPYTDWHDLSICYGGLGYTIESAADRSVDDEPAHTELRLVNELGRHGLVMFAAYTESDQPIAPPRSQGGLLIGRLRRAIEDRQHRESPRGRVYQVQMFAESGLGFTTAEQEELLELFQEMRQQIASSGTPHSGSKQPSLEPVPATTLGDDEGGRP